MEINFGRLRQLIEKYAKPRWIEKEDAWYLRDGGGVFFWGLACNIAI